MSEYNRVIGSVIHDAVIYGTGFMREGKHITMEEYYKLPESKDDEIAGLREALGQVYNEAEDRAVAYEAEIAELKREVAGLSLTLAEMEEAP